MKVRNQSVQVQLPKVRINNDDLEEINKNSIRKRFVARKIEEAQSSIPLKSISMASNQFIQKLMYKMFMTILEN